MLKKFKIKKDQERAAVKFKLYKDYLLKNSHIVDIGTGSGQFSAVLQDKGYNVTAVDIVDKTNTNDIAPVVYDGQQLPFQGESFDISMLITVLHHCPDPEQVFAEAVRVSRKRIFILEDVYSNWVMKRLTWFMDSLMNLEFAGHPHSNKSEAEWENLFNKHNLKVVHKKKVKILLIFTQVVFVLDKE